MEHQSFQDSGSFRSHLTLRQKTKGFPRRKRLITRQRDSMRCLARGTPFGFRLMVIVNEKKLNLEKTTSSVLSVLLLIYDLDQLFL